MEQQTLINTILQAITPVATVILQIGLVLFVAVATQFVKKYLVKIGIVIDDDQMKVIEDLVKKAVITVNQKTVDDMKAMSPNGKLTEDQQNQVYKMAYDIIKTSLSEDQLGLLKKIYGESDKGIEMLIENMVVKAKEDKVLSSAIEIAPSVGELKQVTNPTFDEVEETK